MQREDFIGFLENKMIEFETEKPMSFIVLTISGGSSDEISSPKTGKLSFSSKHMQILV